MLLISLVLMILCVWAWYLNDLHNDAISAAESKGALDTVKQLQPRIEQLVAENYRLFDQYLEAKISFEQAVAELERRGL